MKALEDFVMVGHPRAAIIFAFSTLEVLKTDLVIAKIRAKDRKTYENLSAAVKARLLHDLGIITAKERQRITWLRKLRNSAAHDPTFSVTNVKVPNYCLMPEAKHLSALQNALLTIVGGFWNAHTELRQLYQSNDGS